jgi:2',3'-cyclic-nucleotide 2'-phosphodiesterase/3'-nucleotidase
MQIKLLSTSDVHGFIAPTDFRQTPLTRALGLAKAATVIHDLKQQATPDDMVLTLENGDFIQGSILTNYLRKEAPQDLDIYQQLADMVGYDARILGNHEFNFGLDYLSQAVPERANVLNANILTDDDTPFMGQPYHIFSKGDVRVAVLGLTTAYIPNWERPEHLSDLHFHNPITIAQYWVPRLRQMADIVVVAYHGGFERDLQSGEPTEALTNENQGYELIQTVPGIDALITGHQHRQEAQLVQTPWGHVPITQPGYRGSHVGEISLTLDNEYNVIDATAQLHVVDEQVLPTSRIQATIAPLMTAVDDYLDKPVGEFTQDLTIHDPMQARLQHHPYLHFINTVQMAAGSVDIAATALFDNDSTGFGQSISRRDIATNYVYPNTVMVLAVTGADILAALEQTAGYFTLVDGRVAVSPEWQVPKPQHFNYDVWSGIDYTFDLLQPVGRRVTQLDYHGQPMDMHAVYEVALSNYRGVGGGNYAMFNQHKVVRDVQIDMTDLIADYVEAHSPVSVVTPQNLTVKY